MGTFCSPRLNEQVQTSVNYITSYCVSLLAYQNSLSINKVLKQSTELILILGLAASAACDDTSGLHSNVGELHPVPENYITKGVKHKTIHNELGSSSSAMRFVPRAQIGAMDNPPEEVFGHVVDAAVQDSRLLILDGRFNEMRVFSPDGSYKQTFAGPGQGPGELTGPNSISVRKNQVYILDRLGRRISIYRVEGGSYEHDRDIFLGIAATDICSRNGELYVMGYRPESAELIHVYDSDGGYLRSFGQVYEAKNPLAWRRLTRSHLVCGDDHELVYLMPKLLPEVRSFRPDGTLVWRTIFEDYEPVGIEERPEGYLMRAREEGFNRGLGLVSSEDGTALIAQIDYIASDASSDGWMEIQTYMLDPETGEGIRVGGDVGKIVVWWDRNVVWSRQMPYPHLVVGGVEMTRRGGGEPRQ